MRQRMRAGWLVLLIGGVLAIPIVVGPSAASAAPGQTSLFGHLHVTGGGPSAHSLSPSALPANVQVVATGLNQPRKLVIGPDGNLLVTEAGLNSVPAGCADGSQTACANPSGAIARVTPSGQVSTVVSNLPSVNFGPGSPGASGPSGITIANGQIQFLTQNNNLDQTTGAQPYGLAGALLGSLLSAPLAGGTPTQQIYLGTYEAQNPDHGAGGPPPPNNEPLVDSDPYGITPYNGGLAIADAAANDVLLFKNGTLSLLADLPPVTETGVPFQAQAVPTSLAVGPDGALYIGELGGAPNNVGAANVYRYTNGQLTVYQSGFTMIGDIAFDQAGRLLVLEMDQAGFADTMPGGLPTPGALIRVNANGSRTVLASTGLEYPGGIAVAADGSIYATNWSVLQGSGDPNLPPGVNIGGEIVRIASKTPADQIGANFGGYRQVASDGGIFTFGAFGFYGSMGGKPLNKPVVGMESTPLGPGYWEVASDGGIFSFGTAQFYGSMGGKTLNAPIVGMAATPDGRGYYEFASDGGVFSFGGASFFGSMGSVHLNKPIVGGAVTPDGKGYWLFASDGGIFSLGDAGFFGSEGGKPLNQLVVGGAATPTGGGYYLVASDGGIFAFGNAVFDGSMGGKPLNKPVVGLQVMPNNGGYNLVASDGGVFSFGNAVFYGSMGGKPLNMPMVGIG
jgi:sugar lactone lactonase YvrE